MGSLSIKQVDAEFAEVIRPAVVATHRLAGNVSSRLVAVGQVLQPNESRRRNLPLVNLRTSYRCTSSGGCSTAMRCSRG